MQVQCVQPDSSARMALLALPTYPTTDSSAGSAHFALSPPQRPPFGPPHRLLTLSPLQLSLQPATSNLLLNCHACAAVLAAVLALAHGRQKDN